MRRKALGLTLLEMLFVLVVIATIVTVTIGHFWNYRRELQIARINHDVFGMRQALNRYYHYIGCNQAGVFPRDKRHPGGGLPWIVPPSGQIEKYIVRVIDSGVRNKQRKPIYQLVVQAQLDPMLTVDQVQGLGGRLHVSNIHDHTLTWIGLPQDMLRQADELWILNGYGNSEKQRLQQAEGQQRMTADLSSSYCAR